MNSYNITLFLQQVPIYIIAQLVGSMLGTYIGSLVYGIKPDVMMTKPMQGCNSAFWVELIATFIIMFLVVALTFEHQSVRSIDEICILKFLNNELEFHFVIVIC